MKTLLIIIIALVVILIVIPMLLIVMLCLTKGGREFLGQVGCDMTDDDERDMGHFISTNEK